MFNHLLRAHWLKLRHTKYISACFISIHFGLRITVRLHTGQAHTHQASVFFFLLRRILWMRRKRFVFNDFVVRNTTPHRNPIHRCAPMEVRYIRTMMHTQIYTCIRARTKMPKQQQRECERNENMTATVRCWEKRCMMALWLGWQTWCIFKYLEHAHHFHHSCGKCALHFHETHIAQRHAFAIYVLLHVNLAASTRARITWLCVNFRATMLMWRSVCVCRHRARHFSQLLNKTLWYLHLGYIISSVFSIQKMHSSGDCATPYKSTNEISCVVRMPSAHNALYNKIFQTKFPFKCIFTP